MAKINLADVRSLITSGGIISASHMSGAYDALISGSNDDKYFGGVTISPDKIIIGTNNTVNGEGSLALGSGNIIRSGGSLALGTACLLNNDNAIGIGFANNKQYTKCIVPVVYYGTNDSTATVNILSNSNNMYINYKLIGIVNDKNIYYNTLIFFNNSGQTVLSLVSSSIHWTATTTVDVGSDVITFTHNDVNVSGIAVVLLILTTAAIK